MLYFLLSLSGRCVKRHYIFFFATPRGQLPCPLVVMDALSWRDPSWSGMAPRGHARPLVVFLFDPSWSCSTTPMWLYGSDPSWSYDTPIVVIVALGFLDFDLASVVSFSKLVGNIEIFFVTKKKTLTPV